METLRRSQKFSEGIESFQHVDFCTKTSSPNTRENMEKAALQMWFDYFNTKNKISYLLLSIQQIMV